jgi:6-phosphofructokinase 2
MIHLFSPAPALDLEAVVRPPVSGKIGALGRWSFSPGGKAVNLARFLRAWKMNGRLTLGSGGARIPATFCTRRSSVGRVACFLCGPCRPIRLNLVTHQPESSSKYNHSGFPLSAKSLATYERETLARLKRGDTWVLAGRVPFGASLERVPAWVKRLERQGVRCVVDTSGLLLKALLKASPSFSR